MKGVVNCDWVECNIDGKPTVCCRMCKQPSPIGRPVTKTCLVSSGKAIQFAYNKPPPPAKKTESQETIVGGAGYYLMEGIKSWGIEETPNCPCKARAAAMDRYGPDWCERNLELITDWLEEEAKKRPLLKYAFNRTVVQRLLIKPAIRKARQYAKDHPPDTQSTTPVPEGVASTPDAMGPVRKDAAAAHE